MPKTSECGRYISSARSRGPVSFLVIYEEYFLLVQFNKEKGFRYAPMSFFK
jgi:hypothetical protein